MPEYYRLVAEIVSLFIVTGGILWKLSGMTTRFEMIGRQQAGEITEMKNAIKELITYTNRVDRLEERQLAEGRRIDGISETLRDMIIGKVQISR